MKAKFSSSWKGSKQKRKQVKFRINAPLHIKKKLISANLSKELRKRFNKRSLPLRKGDTVKIMRGKFSKKKGKIESIELRFSKVYVEGIQETKHDGNKFNVPIDASNLQIEELNLDDKKRIKSKTQENKPKTKQEKAKNTKE